MRKLKNILISGILSVCMVVTSLPAMLFAQEVETAQEENVKEGQEDTRDKVQYELISFEALSESVKNQSVALGTDIEELELPESLTASYRSFKEKPEDEKEPEDNTGAEGGEEESEDNTGAEGGEEESEDNTGDKGEEEEPEDNTGNEDDEKNLEESAGDEGGEKDPEDNTENEDEGKIPEVKPEDDDSEGNLEADTVVSETSNQNESKILDKTASETKIVQKSVEVHMKEYNAQPEDMDVPKTLVSEDSEAGAELNEETDRNGENRQRDNTETIVIGNITWISSPSYDGDVEGIYVFTPVIAEDYVLSEEAVLPEIIVTVNAVEEADLSEEAEMPDNDVEVTPEIGVIDTDTTWTAGTLTDGTVTIDEGVVLTITDVITIDGQVTFEGSGTIERGDGKAYFVVNGDKELTLDVKIDGKSQNSYYPMIDVKDKGNLSLKEDCTISNCVGTGSGKTIYSSGGNIVIEGATIEKCFVAGTDGGAIHAIRGSLTINGAVIDNCSSDFHAGGIYAIEVDTTIDDTEIKNCRSGANGGAIHISGEMTVNNTIIENCSASANGGGIAIFEGVVTFNNTTIKGCSTPSAAGGIAVDENSKLTLNSVTIENCVAGVAGGAIIVLTNSELIINRGTYKNNSTTLTEGTNSDGFGGGGAIFVGGVLKIYDGNFINNTAVGKGGGIYHSGYTDATTYLYGGHFEGNTCTDPQYAGSGAVFIASEGYEDDDGYNIGDTTFVLSDTVEFCGDGVSPATDGIFLDSALNIPRRLRLINSLSYPLDIHLDAVEHYIIAEGIETDSGEPYIIQKQDMKKMSIHDTKGEKWYTYLDEENNQVYISKTPPSKVTAAFYSGEADSKEIISQELADGDESVTIQASGLKAMDGWEAVGWSTDLNGYSGNVEVGETISLSEDTNYYGIYKKLVELLYDASAWSAVNPAKQSSFRYANVHSEITYKPASLTVAPSITRAGYSFVGWSTSRNVDESLHIYRPNESIELEDSATLYAQMIDDIAPVLSEASYNSGYTDIGNWLVRKKDLVIIVPITEEGSGVNKIVYTLTPENGEPITGEALMQEAYVSRQVRQAAVVQLDVSGGKMNVTSQDTTAAEQTGTAGGQVGTIDGKIQARITISEDYKGTVTLKCIDNAGNESADKLLTATGGGVIVEDNAPQINFVSKNIKSSKALVNVSVTDDVDTDKNSHITGGIASIAYQVDNKQEQNVTAKNFAEEIVPACEFSVDISGSGEHTLKVTAIDNAGNESQQSTKVIITAKNKKTAVIERGNDNPSTGDEKEFVALVKVNKPEPSKDSEPATGDNSIRVEVYATIAMIAGLLYILLYFITGNNGMTEEDKNEFVSRILTWAKKGGKFRKYVAIAAIFCVLFYYHSIGKRVNVEWKEVVGS